MEKRLKKYLKGGRFENVSRERSSLMSSVRGKHNRSTELRLKMALVRAGVKGWILHASQIVGTPDFYFPSRRLAVFVDGCFWHGCPVCGHIPKTRTEFWRAKIKRTKQRDRLQRRKLEKQGIAVLRVWEHELRGKNGLMKVVDRIKKYRSVRSIGKE